MNTCVSQCSRVYLKSTKCFWVDSMLISVDVPKHNMDVCVHTLRIQYEESETESIKYGFDTRVIWRARPESVYLSPINIIPRSCNSSGSSSNGRVRKESLPLERINGHHSEHLPTYFMADLLSVIFIHEWNSTQPIRPYTCMPKHSAIFDVFIVSSNNRLKRNDVTRQAII